MIEEVDNEKYSRAQRCCPILIITTAMDEFESCLTSQVRCYAISATRLVERYIFDHDTLF